MFKKDMRIKLQLKMLYTFCYTLIYLLSADNNTFYSFLLSAEQDNYHIKESEYNDYKEYTKNYNGELYM